METIIGILFILLPLILKLVGRKFEQSGNAAKAEQLKELAKAFGEEEEDSEDDDVGYDDDGQIVNVPPAPKMAWTPVREQDVMAEKPKIAVEGYKAIARKPVLLEEEPKKKREKIDPKKMVVYSEIMKPKFEE